MTDKAAAIYMNTTGHSDVAKSRGFHRTKSGIAAHGNDLESQDKHWHKTVQRKFLLSKNPDPVLKQRYVESLRQEREQRSQPTKPIDKPLESEMR